MNHRRPPFRKSGAVLVMVLVALSVATAIGVAMMKNAFQQHKLIERMEFEAQARWLVESGLQRAAARLAEDGTYRGEEWAVPAAQLDGRHDAIVTIRVESMPNQGGERRVQATANYPQKSIGRVRRVKQVTMSLRKLRDQQ